MADDKAHVLVLAEKTADSDGLLEALQERAASGPVAFTLVVPAEPDTSGVPDAAVADLEMPDAKTSSSALDEELAEAVERLREAGLEVSEGRVGDADPVAAVADAVNFGDFDDIIVSTSPTHLTSWLKLDVAHRIEGMTDLPIKHVTTEKSDTF